MDKSHSAALSECHSHHQHPDKLYQTKPSRKGQESLCAQSTEGATGPFLYSLHSSTPPLPALMLPTPTIFPRPPHQAQAAVETIIDMAQPTSHSCYAHQSSAHLKRRMCDYASDSEDDGDSSLKARLAHSPATDASTSPSASSGGPPLAKRARRRERLEGDYYLSHAMFRFGQAAADSNALDDMMDEIISQLPPSLSEVEKERRRALYSNNRVAVCLGMRYNVETGFFEDAKAGVWFRRWTPHNMARR